MGRVLAIIGDLQSSKALPNRAELQDKLAAVLAESNSRLPPLSPWTITLGDEFQALYGTATHLFPEILAIQAALHPVGIRMALGIGILQTPINSRQAIGMDGPAFHLARNGINLLREEGDLFRVDGEDPSALCIPVINGFCQLLWRSLSASRSRNPYRLLEGELRNLKDKDIAAALQLDPGTVSRAKQVLNIKESAVTLRSVEKSINAMLSPGILDSGRLLRSRGKPFELLPPENSGGWSIPLET